MMADKRIVVLLILLYFGQGLPYGFQVKLLPLLLRKQDVSLSNVGLSRLLSLPWIFKFTVAPLVDNLWSLHSWIVAGSLAMSSLCFFSAFVGVRNMYFLLISVLFMNLTTAVQDVAVDTFSISLLNPSDLGKGSTFQVVGYKVGVVCGSGLLAWLSTSLGWQFLFCLWGLYYILILSLLLLKSHYDSEHGKRKEVQFTASAKTMVDSNSTVESKETNLKQDRSHKGDNILLRDNKTGSIEGRQILRTILQTPGFLWLLSYLLIYKMGEQGIVSMLPLFLIDQGIPHDQVVLLSGICGQCFSITGSLVGGWISSLQNGQRSWVISTLQYVSFARLLPIAVIWLLSQMALTKYSAVILECLLQLSGGIITTATFTLIMLSAKTSSEGTKASHSAALATAEVLGKLSMSAISGILVDIVGYQKYFGLCFVLSLLVVPVLQAGVNIPEKKEL